MAMIESKNGHRSGCEESSIKYCLRLQLSTGSALGELWREEQLCDVVLESKEGVHVRSHKIILAAASPFFRALFTGSGRYMAECQEKLPTGENIVKLPAVEAQALQSISHALYDNTIEISDCNLENVLAAANLLEIAPVRYACCQFLKSKICVENCLMILEISETYNCFQLREETMKYVCERFSDVLMVSQWKQVVGKLTKMTVLEIIQSQDITVESERQILSFGLWWIRSDEIARRQEGQEIISRVQLPQKAIREEIFAADMRPSDLLPHAQQAGSMPIDAPLFNKTASRTPTHIIVAGGHDASWRTFKTVEIYDPSQDLWIKTDSMPNSFSISGAATIGRCAFVVGASLYNDNVCRFEKRTSRWSQCPSLNTSRIHSAVASAGSALYVCGGRTGLTETLNTTEVYRSLDSTPEWREGPSMCHPRCAFDAVSLWGDLFAVGGQSLHQIHSSAEFLPRGGEEWTLLESSHLKTPRKYHSVTTTPGRIYAVGGMNEQRHRLRSVEALDPREGKWREVAPLIHARSSCYAASFRGTLYVMGGNSGDNEILNSVEKYYPETDTWLPCASLVAGRSGLSVAAI